MVSNSLRAKCAGISLALLLAFSASQGNAQGSVWNGLARTQFDSDALTLRIPCARLVDGNGNDLPGYAPAYALNLLYLEQEQRFRLVEPLQAFDAVPESCLDSLTVDGNSASYRTSSAEIDSESAAVLDRFYTRELHAELGTGGTVEFDVLNAEVRQYRRPGYVGEQIFANLGPPPFTTDFIFDGDFLEGAYASMDEGLRVYEPGRVEVTCFYFDPLGFLEVVDGSGDDTRYRLRATVSSADNDLSFILRCRAFNHDINRLEQQIDLITWFITL